MPSDPFAPSKKLLGYTYSNTQNNKIDLPDIPKDFVKFNELIGKLSISEQFLIGGGKARAFNE